MSDRKPKPKINRPSEPGPVQAREEFYRSAEFHLLASMLRWNEGIDEVLRLIPRPEGLRPSFQAREIFAAMVHLHESGRRVDVELLAEEAKKRNIIDDLGGYTIFVDLWNAQPTGANIVYWAERCRDAAIRWHLSALAVRLGADTALPDEPAESLLDRYEREMQSIGIGLVSAETESLAKVIADTTMRIDRRKSHSGCSGISTGFCDLDSILSGFQDGELMLVAARPGVGKTMLACNLLRNVCGDGIPALFVSLEQARVEIAERILCAEARVDSHKVRRGIIDSGEIQKLVDAGESLGRFPLKIDDTPCQNVSRIAATARRLQRKDGLRLVCIDYIQLIDADDRRVPRHEQVAAISRRLKIVARELSIPIVALCQVNRSSEDRGDGRPRLSDLRESGALEADADTVLLLHQPKGEFHKLIVDVAKQRNGPIDEMTLTFLKPFGRFENHAADFGPIPA